MLVKAARIAVLFMTISLSLATAHDGYSHLTDKLGASCCNDRDCQPAPYRFTATGLQMFVNRRWIDVPSDKIQYVAIPGDTGETGGGHWCGLSYEPSGGPLYITHCAILPPQSASVH
jgi:hypothetical protein